MCHFGLCPATERHAGKETKNERQPETQEIVADIGLLPKLLLTSYPTNCPLKYIPLQSMYIFRRGCRKDSHINIPWPKSKSRAAKRDRKPDLIMSGVPLKAKQQWRYLVIPLNTQLKCSTSIYSIIQAGM